MAGSAEPRLTIAYTHPGGRGWDTVTLMAELAARLLGAELLRFVNDVPYTKAFAARDLLPRHRVSGTCLVIAPQPAQLGALLESPLLGRRFEVVAGYVIDSFWTDRIPRLARGRGRFDHLFVTDGELAADWTTITGTPTTWLPFASDVMGLPAPAERPVDLQRVGRQPGAWDDDDTTAAAAARLGLVFRGRPPYAGDPAANQAGLTTAMASAKYTLSFSNAVSPAPYTHPSREYLTGRWTDALACGATVAGIAPHCDATRELLWPGATLELSSTDREAGLAEIAAAAASWTPERAVTNHRLALERLDWRHRFKVVADTLGLTAPVLDTELSELQAHLEETGESEGAR
jgi:hypothetical protein